MFRVKVKGFLVMSIFEVYIQNSNGNSILTINFNCDLVGYFSIICYYHNRMYRKEDFSLVGIVPHPGDITSN
jgi:hypothetical protein